MTGTRAAFVCAAVVFILQWGWGPRYPIFRDEFYYLACADHLAWGYVDHPPFSIAVLAAWRAVFGDSIVALRVLPSLAAAAIVLLTSGLAGALGGGGYARTLAAVAILAAPTVFGTTGFYSMNAFDFLFWLAAAHLLVRLAAAEAFVAHNTLNHATVDTADARLGLVAAGKTYYDLRAALDRLGLTEAELERRGIRIFKPAVLWPMDPGSVRHFARGLDTIVVVEEKRALVEAMTGLVRSTRWTPTKVDV